MEIGCSIDIVCFVEGFIDIVLNLLKYKNSNLLVNLKLTNERV